MHTELLNSSRITALAPMGGYVGFAVFLLFVNRGDAGSVTGFMALGAVVLGLWEGREVVQPRQMLLDRQGLIFRPSFGMQQGPIAWQSVASFEIVKKNKREVLVCHYREESEPAKSLNLGGNWCLNEKDWWPSSNAAVLDYLQHYARTGMSPASHPVPASRSVEQRAVEALKTGPVAAQTRSGVQYPDRLPGKLVDHRSKRTGKGTGWGLLLAGVVMGGLTVIPFMQACRQGLCAGDLWNVSDVRIWVFAGVWTLSLLLIALGAKRILDTNDDGSFSL
ncbi:MULTISPECIES: hypothetical protein [unclassified Brevundimonas]|uniref:hypothetical protein n=1 Tax=unclassified Brevundimonas TaxID=2622653 RepID=UPI0025C5D188|nr:MULTISPECIES: hypothetical protein [unclassified Brevundimonas]